MHIELNKLLDFKFEANQENNELKNSITHFCEEWLSGKEYFEIFTSGSTGEPKLITLTRAQMQASAHTTIKALGLQSGDRALVCLNTNYIGGKMMLVRGLESQLTMTIVPPIANPFKFIPPDTYFDFASFVPYQLQTILQESPEKIEILNRAKAIIIGGAPVSAQLEEVIQRIEAPIFNTYGMTETVSHIALRRLNGPEASNAFHVLPDIEIGTDNEGCLNIRGAVSNYHFLQTRDLVEIISADKFIWIGRADNVINSGGIKIQTDKVEKAVSNVFAELSISNRHFIYGLPDENFGTVANLIIEGYLDEDIKSKIMTELSLKLGKYEIPKKIIEIKRFTETASGKIDRKASAMNLL